MLNMSAMGSVSDLFINASLWFVMPTPTADWPLEHRSPDGTYAHLTAELKSRQLRNCTHTFAGMMHTHGKILSKIERAKLLDCRNLIDSLLLLGREGISHQSNYSMYKKREFSGTVKTESEAHYDPKWWEVRNCTQHFCLDFDFNSTNCHNMTKEHGKNYKIPENCLLCNPRNNTAIVKHCKSMVHRERTAFYVLVGILVIVVLAVILAVLIKKCRDRRKRRLDKRGGPGSLQSRAEKPGDASKQPSPAAIFVDGPSGEAWTGFFKAPVTARDTISQGIEEATVSNIRRRGNNSSCDRASDGENVYPTRQYTSGVDSAKPFDMIRVMPPATNAKCRSSSLEVRAISSCMVNLRRGSAEPLRQKHRSTEGSNVSMGQTMPMTSQVIRYGLGGRLCKSRDAEVDCGQV